MDTSIALSSRIRARALRSAAALLFASALAACDNPVETPSVTLPETVASVLVEPGWLELIEGGYQILGATPVDRLGRPLTGRAIEWRSDDPAIARVDESGNVVAMSPGTVRISATIEGKEGAATVVVSPVPPPTAVAQVQITGGDATIWPGEVVQLGVHLRDADGEILTDRTVTWSSNATDIAIVEANGAVHGLRGGQATITATVEGISASTTISIPPWMTYQLQEADENGLPHTVLSTVETTDSTEMYVVRKHRRVKLTFGMLYLATTNLEYHFHAMLETWEREVTTYAGGSTISTMEVLVENETILDSGTATTYDIFTGSPIYTSETFPGHAFVVQGGPSGLEVSMPIPGIATEVLDLHFIRAAS